MQREFIASRSFTLSDQLDFARLSGDSNPMHLDALAARRTQAGAPVVHGVHAVLWALDTLAALGHPVDRITALGVRFTRFMYLDTPIAIAAPRETKTGFTVELSTDGQLALTLTAKLAAERPASRIDIPPDAPAIATPDKRPLVMTFEDLDGLVRHLDPVGSAADWGALFPAASRAIGADRVAALAQLSRLVGMIAPGLHSIFGGFTVDLVADGPDRPGIGFRVTTADPRYRIVKIDVAGGGLSGNVSAFMRQPPVEPPSVASLAALVSPGECAGSLSLLVGASRGLGAITAKLLAAGGGRVIVTYASGRDDAEKLCSEINAAFGEATCTSLALDARSPIAPQLAALSEPVTHLYYFATPQIFRQKGADAFSPQLFAEFCRFYVDAFWETVAALTRVPPRNPLSVFYPSSVAVDERPAGLTEYAMAKIAGETLCADLGRATPPVDVLVSRLPRMLTDQTATVAEVKSADPVTVMLDLIRQIHGRQRAA
jgi:hypothetical protein